MRKEISISNPINILARWISTSRHFVAFTGAGISTESGIPDFRSPGGVWSQNEPVYYNDFLQSHDSRKEYWRQKSIAHQDFTNAKPNISHEILSLWEKRNLLKGLITQNIDGLHQDAGSETVSEIHGTARWVNCQSCSWKEKADFHVEQFVETGEVPSCPECNGLVKHSTISFGQSLDPAVMSQSNVWSQKADLYLAMGSSLVVQPAASLPVIAKESGSRLVIINRDPTPLDNLADLVIHEPLGETLKKVEEAILNSDKL